MSAPSNLQAIINEYLEIRMELTMRCQLALLRAQLDGSGDGMVPSAGAHGTTAQQVPPQAIGGEKAAVTGGGKPKPPARQQQNPRAALPQQPQPQALLGGPIEDPTAGGQS